ncbi:MAG: proline dehydrogenase family protein [Anaerolineales bacterium]|nr:proline dehydrogenase family protein [Anaerolineales bacterium]MCB9129127.1 proline dehydrogenase family protein [Ardenticatenales bacterium]
MLRNILLTMSQSEMLRKVATGFPPARMVSRRWVAGEQLSEALSVVESLRQEGLMATLDFLGENTNSRVEADFYTEEIIRALNALAAAELTPNVSLKLTAMGFDISDEVATANLRRVLQAAQQYDNAFVRIDMESSDYIDRTLAIYRQMRAEGFNHTGVVIQSYLYRSEKDVLALIDQGAKVRLVKGAYDEPPHLAYPEKRDVDANFVHLMELLMSAEARQKGVYAAIATHDPKMVEVTKLYANSHDVPRDAFEFQMLYGISTSMHHQLVADGYRFRVYVPYGTHWYPYFMRRLAERPANVLFILRSLARR